MTYSVHLADRKDCLNLLRFAYSIGKLLALAGMPVEDIPAFQERIRHNVTYRFMRVRHPRKVYNLILV